MTMLAGVRLWRPSATALFLVLLVAILAPLAIAPSRAEAVPNPCKLPGVSTVCDGADAAGSALGDLGQGAIDLGKFVVNGAKTVGKWAGDNAGRLVKAAAVAGLALGTWVACSKVIKVVATAGAGAAGAVGTGGAGGVPAAAAGAAGAAGACMLLQKGGRVLLKVGKKSAKGGGKLAGVAKLAAGAVGLAAIVYGVDHAAAWVLQNLLDLDAASAPNLDAGWLTELRKSLNGMAGVLLVLATILGMTIAGALGRASDVGRIFTSMISVALIIGVVGSLLLASLRVSDEVTAGTLNSTWGQQALGNWKDLGDSYADASPKSDDEPAERDAVPSDGADASGPSQTGTPPADEKGPWPVRLLIAFCTALFGALVWLEMQIRDGLLYLLLAFGGLLLAAYPFPATRGIAQRFGMTLLGVVVAKPVIVITLLIGGAMMQSAAAGGTDGGAVVPMLQGAGLMALAALMGTAILAWFNLHGASTMTGLGNRMVAGSGRGMGGSRSGGSPGTGGPSGGGPGGGGPGAPDRPDPTRDLARGVGDRVNAGGPSVGGTATAAAAGVAGGAISSRLQAAQARERHTPTGARGEADASDVGPSTGAPQASPGGSSADAPTRPMPVVANSTGPADSRPPADDDALDLTSSQQTTPVTPRTGSDAPTEPERPDPVAAAAAAASGRTDGAAPPHRDAPQTAEGPGEPTSAAAAPIVSDGPATPPTTTSSSAAVGAAAGEPTPISETPARPINHPAAASSAPTAAASNTDAYTAFGVAAPADAAAAFGDHAARLHAALDARPEIKA